MEWLQVVRDIGFPIFVAAYLLLKLPNELSYLREQLVEIKEILKQLRDGMLLGGYK